MAGAMIYVHEVHEVLGGKMEEFGDAVRREWRPLVEDGERARLLWFWQLTHGTGASYQAVSITAVRDWATWGELVGDPRLRAWQQRGWALRREVTAKVLLPVAWSPLREVEDWSQFSRLLTQGEPPARPGGWMEEGLRYRDRWESKLLRCARWSPRQ